MLGFSRVPSRAPGLSLERTTALAALTGVAFGDIAGLNGTIVSRGVPIRVMMSFGLMQCNIAGNGANVQVLEDVGDTGSFAVCGLHIVRPVIAANGFNSGGMQFRDRPARPAGTVIRYKVQAGLIAAGASTTITCNATADPFCLSADHLV